MSFSELIVYSCGLRWAAVTA